MQSKPLFILLDKTLGEGGREGRKKAWRIKFRVSDQEGEIVPFLKDLSLLTWIKPRACLPCNCPENLAMVMHEGAVSLCCYNRAENILPFRWNWFKTTWASSHVQLVPSFLPLVSFKYSWMLAYSAISLFTPPPLAILAYYYCVFNVKPSVYSASSIRHSNGNAEDFFQTPWIIMGLQHSNVPPC